MSKKIKEPKRELPTHEELIAFIEGWDLVKPNRTIDHIQEKKE